MSTTKLSAKCISIIPKNTFANLLLHQFNIFAIDKHRGSDRKGKYEKIQYHHVILTNNCDISLVSSTHKEEIREQDAYIYESRLLIYYLNNYIEEDIEYIQSNDAYKYRVLLKTADKRYIHSKKIEDLKVNEEIRRIYEEIQYKIHN
jgi:hypothetical protein